jgi:uncharacterized membrane protein
VWQPVCAWPWLVVALALVVAAVAWSLVRGIRSWRRVAVLGILRALMLVLLGLMLLQPQRRIDEVTTLRPQLAVLVDGSESMTDPVDDKQPQRAQRVLEWFGSNSIGQAMNDFDLRIFRFDGALTEQSQNVKEWKFNGATSRVVEAVNQVQERFRGQPLAGVLLLSDGLDTAGSPETVSASVPVFSFELGKPFTRKQRTKRISLAGVDCPPRVAVGWNTEIRVSLAGSGLAGQTVSVGLWQDGHLQAEQPVAFNEDEQTRSVTFAVSHDKQGTVPYEIRVSDPAADKDARSHPFLIDVMEPGNRVLYVQNALGFDFKFLRKAIVSDRNLKLSAFVRWADGRLARLESDGSQAGGDADFSPKALANCAVVILGDLAPEALSSENSTALRNFVDHGGGLVLLGGPNLFASKELAAGPLAAALPVGLPAPYREGKFPVRITDTGLHHPVFGPLFAQVKDFPHLLTCNTASSVAPTAEVLMQIDAGGTVQPLVVGMRFGQGRVVAVLTDTMWRWRLASRGWSSDGSPYDTFWRQLMDWLIPKEQDKENGSRIELFTEHTNYVLGEHPEVRAIVRTAASGAALPATLPLRLRTPDEQVFDYVLKPAVLQTPGGKPVNGYRAEIEPNLPGVFLAQSSVTLDGVEAAGETRFVVNRPATEITGKPINRELLKRISSATGGRFYAMEDWDAWRRDLHFKQQQFSRVELQDLWNHPMLLGLLLLLLGAEWIVRKYWSLP